MSYSKKNNNVRWLYGSWAFFAVVGLVIGIVATNIIHKSGSPPEQIEQAEPPPMYGTRDNRTFLDSGEMSRDWGSGDLNFKPLDCSLDERTQEFIYYLSYGYYIDFPFVMGLIQQESAFQADVISATNDYGLMQINKQNHKWLREKIGVDDFLDPEQNIRAGLYILRGLFEKYDDPAKVLMAYNLGESGASLLWEQGIFETNYSNKILNYAEQFKQQIESEETKQ
ncbi:hypothetical protein FACS1894217_05090 [Clostridia bacterium]|nr:hypothetical protein FACS1894217_05090 [Clostridia bacterium]